MRMGARFIEEGRKCRLHGFLYAEDLVLCGVRWEGVADATGLQFECVRVLHTCACSVVWQRDNNIEKRKGLGLGL